MAKNKMSRGKKLPKEYEGTIARDTTRYRPGLVPAWSPEGKSKPDKRGHSYDTPEFLKGAKKA